MRPAQNCWTLYTFKWKKISQKKVWRKNEKNVFSPTITTNQQAPTGIYIIFKIKSSSLLFQIILTYILIILTIFEAPTYLGVHIATFFISQPVMETFWGAQVEFLPRAFLWTHWLTTRRRRRSAQKVGEIYETEWEPKGAFVRSLASSFVRLTIVEFLLFVWF